VFADRFDSVSAMVAGEVITVDKTDTAPKAAGNTDCRAERSGGYTYCVGGSLSQKQPRTV